MEHPETAIESIDPDGESAILFHDDGFGWSNLCPVGHRVPFLPTPLWRGPFGGTYFHLSGWPFFALKSRVEVLDSQVANRTYEGAPPPTTILVQRTRWQLPPAEILHRGLATNDLPAFFHARPGRRLSLFPLPLGFSANTFLFALTLLFAARLLGCVRQRFRREPRGFPVLIPDLSQSATSTYVQPPPRPSK
jgi:hypothetical protein